MSIESGRSAQRHNGCGTVGGFGVPEPHLAFGTGFSPGEQPGILELLKRASGKRGEVNHPPGLDGTSRGGMPLATRSPGVSRHRDEAAPREFAPAGDDV